MKRMLWIIPILFTVSFAHFAGAQFGQPSGPSFYGEFKPVIGGWSEYQITTKREGSMKMKVAIVGKEGDAYWYETVMEGGKRGHIITKMLVSGNPEDPKNIKRLIVKEGDKPAREMPVEMMRQGPSKGQEAKGNIVDKGIETITVPAGAFKAQHMQYQAQGEATDVWIYKDVCPYGLIKSQSKDAEMALTGYGTGAKSQITEAPQKFEMPQMPQIPQIPERRPRRR